MMQVGGNPPKNEMKSGAEIRLAERIWIIAVRLAKGDRGLRPPGPRGDKKNASLLLEGAGERRWSGGLLHNAACCGGKFLRCLPSAVHYEEKSRWRRTGAKRQQRPERKTRHAH